MIWLLLAVACGAALLGWLAGARVLAMDALFERLGDAEVDLAVVEEALEDERAHSDLLAVALANVLYLADHGDTRGFREGVERGVAALRVHDGVRVQR